MPSAPVLPPGRYRLGALLPYPSFRAWWNEPRVPKSEEEKRFERMRWRWIGLAVVGSIGYWLIWAPKVRLVKMADEDGDESLAIVVGVDTVDLDEEEDGEEGEGGDGDGKAER